MSNWLGEEKKVGAISINVADGAAFKNYDEVLEHIHQKHLADGIVRETYLQALREREADYPTGILLDGYAVAIPHCDSQHAVSPAIYIIRLPQEIEVNQADGDDSDNALCAGFTGYSDIPNRRADVNYLHDDHDSHGQ